MIIRCNRSELSNFKLVVEIDFTYINLKHTISNQRLKLLITEITYYFKMCKHVTVENPGPTYSSTKLEVLAVWFIDILVRNYISYTLQCNTFSFL